MTTPIWISIIAAVLSLSTLVLGIFSLRQKANKDTFDAESHSTKVYVDSLLGRLALAESQIATNSRELVECRQRVIDCERDRVQLRADIMDLMRRLVHLEPTVIK